MGKSSAQPTFSVLPFLFWDLYPTPLGRLVCESEQVLLILLKLPFSGSILDPFLLKNKKLLFQ